jgi:hypothetical protein
LSDEASGGLHNARCSDSHENRASLQRVVDPIQFERHFPEPADVRSNPTTALASRNLGWRFVEIRVGKWRAAASIATTLEKLAVHVDNVFCSCLFVKVIHVLGADEQVVLQRVLKFGEGEVCWIWFGCGRHTPTHGIELPYQLRIAVPSYGRSDLCDSVVPPETTHATESWNAALGANPCSSEDEDTIMGRNGEHG